jgi:hypothetical protein
MISIAISFYILKLALSSIYHQLLLGFYTIKRKLKLAFQTGSRTEESNEVPGAGSYRNLEVHVRCR